MADTHSTDLKSLEGPDDWVSLYLDGHADDMLTDLQVVLVLQVSVAEQQCDLALTLCNKMQLGDLPDQTASPQAHLGLAHDEVADPLGPAGFVYLDTLSYGKQGFTGEIGG